MTSSNPAAELSAMRKRVRHHCLQCGKRFNAIKTAKYCSNKCRQAAKYERVKAAREDGSGGE